MANFREVFSITTKVVLALLILGVVVLLVGGALKGIGSVFGSAPQPATPFMNADSKLADAKPESMPETKWKAGIRDAITAHCAVVGMTKDEVSGALGKPEKVYHLPDDVESWSFAAPTRNCVKYSGDRCAEYAVDRAVIYFSPAGHLSGTWAGSCLSGKFFRQHGDLLLHFPPLPRKSGIHN